METAMEPVEGQTIREEARSTSRAVGGMFLTFSLGNEEFGVEILKIVEIIGVQDITIVPHTARFMRGVINLRGKVIPVIDLRSKFALPDADYNDQTCIIVVDVGMLMGIIVDNVQEVHDIPADSIDPPPTLGGAVDADFIFGMGRINDGVKILLDIDRVLNADELVELPGEAGSQRRVRAGRGI